MSISLPKTSISVLPARLKLVSILRSSLRASTWAITRILAFRDRLSSEGDQDPFFNLTLNEIELSIFADETLVKAVFGDDAKNGIENQGVEVSEDTWLAMQVESHDQEDTWDTSGGRVRDISAPLAAEGISILFLSTYISDFLLIKEHRLELVKDILRQNSFYDHNTDEASSSLGPRSHSPYLSAFSPIRESAPLTQTASQSLPPPSLSRSLTGSTVLLSDRDRRAVSSDARDRNRKDSGASPAASPARRQAVSPSSVMHRGSLSILTDRLGSMRDGRATPSPVDSPNTPASPHMSPSRSMDGAMSSLELERPRAPGASEGETASQPRSWEKMQESIHSEASTVSTAAGVFDKIALLPDELVCVGLRQQESLWRGKILHALFFTSDVLSRPAPDSPTDVETTEEDDVFSAQNSKAGLYGTTPTPHRPLNASGMPAAPPAVRSFSASTASSAPTQDMQVTSTSEAPYPTPFLSLTLTTEGASLLADIRLLRELFSGDDEALVYAPGQGGLSGLWGGEDIDDADQDEDIPRGRGAPEEDWEQVTNEDEDDQGRRLFKCLQLDLSSFGLEKAGLAHQFAGILTGERINLLYSSTFRTANILVAKRHIRKARTALEAAAK